MHRMGLWWRQPDHYDWLSDYLAARGLKPFVRYLLAAILTNLAAATLLMLFSSSGPQTPMRRAVAVRVRGEPGGNGIGVAAELANAISIPDVFDNGGTGHRSDLRDRERPARRDAGVRGIWWPGGLRGVCSFRSPAGFHAGQRLSYCTGVRRPHRCGW